MKKIVNKIIKPFYGSGIGKYFPFNLAYNLYNSYLNSKGDMIKTFDLFNIKFNLEINPKRGYIDKNLYVKGFYEKEISKLISQRLKGKKVFVDVGANIGYYSVFASKILKKGRVYAFEPQKYSYKILKKNLSLNNLENVTLVNKGCGSKNEKLSIYSDKNNLGHSSVVRGRPFDNKPNKEDINIIKLDDYFKRKSFDLIKIDVEGFEYEVLKGAKKCLENFSPEIIFEFSPEIYSNIEKDYISYSIDLLYFLKKKGYLLYEIRENTLYLIKDIDIYVNNMNSSQVNIFCKI